MNLLNRKPGKGPGSGSAAVISRYGKKSLPERSGRGAPWFLCAVTAWASLTLCAPAPARTISGTVTGNQYGSEISSGDVTGDLDLSGAHVIGDLIGGLTHDGKAVSSSVRSSGDAGDNINGSVTGGQGTNGAESNVVNLHWCQIVGSRISAGAHVEGGVTESGKAVGNSVTLTDTFLLRGKPYRHRRPYRIRRSNGQCCHCNIRLCQRKRLWQLYGRGTGRRCCEPQCLSGNRQCLRRIFGKWSGRRHGNNYWAVVWRQCQWKRVRRLL